MRLPALKREELLPEKQKLWDRIMAGRSSGGGGPYSALMHAPRLAEHLSTLENYFRSAAALDERDREIIILATAREFDAHFPWTRHEIRGRQVGLGDDVIETLRAKGSLARLAPRERLLVKIVRSLLREHRLSKELFSLGLAELGPEKMVEMVGLIGHYCTISAVANAFEVTPPEGSKTF